MTREVVKILHLEDEQINQMVLMRALKKQGPSVDITVVDTAQGAIDAIFPPPVTDEHVAQLKQNPLYDLLVVDVHVKDTDRSAILVRMDGYAAVDKALAMGYRPDQIIFASDTPDPSRTFERIPMHTKEEALGLTIQAVQNLLLN